MDILNFSLDSMPRKTCFSFDCQTHLIVYPNRYVCLLLLSNAFDSTPSLSSLSNSVLMMHYKWHVASWLSPSLDGTLQMTSVTWMTNTFLTVHPSSHLTVDQKHVWEYTLTLTCCHFITRPLHPASFLLETIQDTYILQCTLWETSLTVNSQAGYLLCISVSEVQSGYLWCTVKCIWHSNEKHACWGILSNEKRLVGHTGLHCQISNRSFVVYCQNWVW